MSLSVYFLSALFSLRFTIQLSRFFEFQFFKHFFSFSVLIYLFTSELLFVIFLNLAVVYISFLPIKNFIMPE